VSLGAIYVCCDDGNFYKCGEVVADDWCIVFDEDHDELLIPSEPRQFGQPRMIPRPETNPQAIIHDERLPIENLCFLGHQTNLLMGCECAVYRIVWKDGKAFPRMHLREDAQPANSRTILGTFCCITSRHEKKLKQTV
jgi:hypothetical protein